MLTPASRQLFSFDAGTVYLDHGGYGVAPNEVRAFRLHMQDKVEAAPRAFFDGECRPAWSATAATVAARFGAEAGDVALVDNVTDGITAVLRSVALGPGDEILITSMTYGAVALAAQHVARERHARIIEARLPFPAPGGEQCVEAVQSALTERTKLAILDHITSGTALVLPIGEMAKVCRERGVAVLVDGAHAPGQVALDVPSLGADWYVGNLHKWYFVPRGCGFLWARSGRQEHLAPAVLSWGIDEPFPQCFWWTGTRDPSGWLSIPAAFAFMDGFGEEAVRRHNQALVREAAGLLTKAWGVQADTPDAMTGSMTVVALPVSAAFHATSDGRVAIQRRLWEEYRIACPCILFEDRLYARISAQIYNGRDDYERLAQAVGRMAG